MCPECEEKVKDPSTGQVYNSTGGATYVYDGSNWTRQGGMLAEVTVGQPFVPARVSSVRNYGGDGSGSTYDRIMYGLDKVNQFLPTTHILNSITYAFTGKDIMGNNMGLGDATLGAVSVLPIAKMGGAAIRGVGNIAVKGGRQLLLKPGAANLTQKGLDHIIARHWFTSGAKGAGKFAEGTTGAGLKSMINTTTTQGVFRANTMGRAGTIAEYNFGRVIGTTSGGAPASSLRVVIGTNGNVITAFPF